MRRFSLLLASVLLALLAFAPAASAAPSAGVTVPVTSTVAGGTLTNATFTIDRVITRAGQLVAVGTLAGTLTNTATGAVSQISQTIRLPITNITGTCQVLHLELGPLDLNLLGLRVHLDRVVLDITAQSGPGNLLGNLLCGIAGLLDTAGPLGSIARLLNQILGILTI